MISHDSVEVLAQAAAELGLQITLLSDADSRFISSLGLLNETIAQQDEADGVEHDPSEVGAAHPGIFVLDEHGCVTERLFHRHYRIRPTGRTLLETLHVAPGLAADSTERVPTVGVEIGWFLSDTHYEPGQLLHLRIQLGIGAGVHVYAPGAEPQLTGLVVRLEGPPELHVEAKELPAPELVNDPFLEREVPVYTGRAEVVVPFALMENVGNVSLVAELRYQACSLQLCHPPGTVRFPFSIRSGSDEFLLRSNVDEQASSRSDSP